jgi:hypothetical protein
MNKEFINTHKDAFLHDLNDGKLVYLMPNGGNPVWCTKSKMCSDELDLMWSNGSHVQDVVINDEYVEFRKALAEGKAIESQVKRDTHSMSYPTTQTEKNSVIWEIDTSKKFDGPADVYRIKPEGHTFPEGTWVLVGNNTKPVQYTTEQYPRNSGLAIKLWKPSRGEWCIFWNSEHSIRPKIAQYTTTNSYGHVTAQYNYNTFDYYIPFTGILPDHL